MTEDEITDPVSTGGQQATQFKPGQSGNPAGRPPGTRNKLQEDFLKDVQAAWETAGPQAITDMIADKPGDFVKMVASLMPKEATLNIHDHSEMTDAELAERVRSLAAQLAPFLIDGTGNANAGDEGAGGKALPSRVH
jgi:hypothetical protein